MTEQDDLFKKDKKQREQTDGEFGFREQEAGGEGDAETVNQGDAKIAEPASKESRADIAGGGIAGGEVRAVEPPSRSAPSNLPLFLLVVIVMLLLGGYVLLSRDGTPKPAVVSAPQKQPIPIRPRTDMEGKEGLPAQKQGAVAETEPAAKKSAEPQKARAAETAAGSPQGEVSEKAVATDKELLATAQAQGGKVAEPMVLYSVMVGPYLSKSKLESAREQLQEMGFEPSQTTGRGKVSMTRLLEGRYPADEARQRLALLKKKVKSAFVLPDGDRRALYAGSFRDVERAEKLMAKLAAEGVGLTPVVSDIEMSGKMLIAVQADQQTAQQVARHISKAGLQTHLIRK